MRRMRFIVRPAQSSRFWYPYRSMEHSPPTTAQRQAETQTLARGFRLRLIYAFGSRAREALAWLNGAADDLQTGGSDLDIGVLAPAPLDIDGKVAIAQALEDLMGARRIDLVDLATADPFLAANIVRGERLFADNSRTADEYDLYVLRRAGDLAPLERERMALVLRSRS